jgi:trans-aconitate methyltransferase
MTAWNEDDSAIYHALAAVAVPRRGEMMAALVAAAPFDAQEPIRILELGSGDGLLSATLLERFPRASLRALDGSDSMRRAANARLAAFGDRVRVAPFDLPTLDWWVRMFGVDLIVSSLALHHLNDAKKRYFYKAAAERMSPYGALLIADLIEPQHAAARTAAADRWDALARGRGRIDRRARSLSTLRGRALESFPLSGCGRSAVSVDAPPGVAASRRLLRCRLRLDGCRARRVRRFQAGWSVRIATSGGQLIRTGT